MNNLFHKLRNTLRKQYGPQSKVIPFAMGRVYQTVYRNYKHDPKPLLLILGSNAFHTIGINIHYLGSWQSSLINFILMLRQSKTLLTGLIIYQLLKRRFPMIPKIAFRKYFTAMLRGRLVSEGISTLPDPDVKQFISEPWVRKLNNLIRPKIFSFRKTEVNPEVAEDIRNQAIQTQYYHNRQRPFADRRQKTVIQYNPREET